MDRTYIGLVRGINVGGNKMVKMADLKAFLSDIGFDDPRTLLQSGNMAFRTDKAKESEIEALLETEAAKRLGLSASFFVRSHSDLEEVIAKNPFPKEAENDPGHLLVTFLKAEPDADLLQSVRAGVIGPERFEAVGRHLYTVFPDGVGASTITKVKGWNKLSGIGTARNWNTVLKLEALARR